MDYIKLGTRYYRDPAILAANKRTAGQAELLFLRALAQCGADEAEGHIPADALLFLGVRNAPKVAAVLVDEGLWDEHGSGWVIRSWDKWQSEHDALARRRRADRERKREARSKAGSGGPSTDPSPGVHVPMSADSPQTSADTSRDSRPPNARDYRDRDGEKDEQPSSEVRDDVERVCANLADHIEANGSKRPTITKRWRDAARLLMDRDGRTEAQVHNAIRWCQQDEFWRGNVLSMPTLREKYDQLRLAAQRPERTEAAKPGNPYLDDLRRAAAAGESTAIPSLWIVPEPPAIEEAR